MRTQCLAGGFADAGAGALVKFKGEVQTQLFFMPGASTYVDVWQRTKWPVSQTKAPNTASQLNHKSTQGVLGLHEPAEFDAHR